jgi:tellurite resistance protein
MTPPSGFDVEAGALFEAIVESAFLVANADGNFDAAERRAFTQVVLEASEHRVSPKQVDAIVSDLSLQLEQDGFEKRARVLSSAISRREHRFEALTIAALLAEVSSGVSSVERQALEVLAKGFDISRETLDELLVTVQKSLSGQN